MPRLVTASLALGAAFLPIRDKQHDIAGANSGVVHEEGLYEETYEILTNLRKGRRRTKLRMIPHGKKRRHQGASSFSNMISGDSWIRGLLRGGQRSSPSKHNRSLRRNSGRFKGSNLSRSQRQQLTNFRPQWLRVNVCNFLSSKNESVDTAKYNSCNAQGDACGELGGCKTCKPFEGDIRKYVSFADTDIPEDENIVKIYERERFFWYLFNRWPKLCRPSKALIAALFNQNWVHRIENVQLSCSLNSIAQCLCAVSELAKYFYHSQSSDPLLRSIRDFVRDYYDNYPGSKVLSTDCIRDALLALIRQETEVYRGSDTLRKIVKAIGDDMKTPTNTLTSNGFITMRDAKSKRPTKAMVRSIARKANQRHGCFPRVIILTTDNYQRHQFDKTDPLPHRIGVQSNRWKGLPALFEHSHSDVFYELRGVCKSWKVEVTEECVEEAVQKGGSIVRESVPHHATATIKRQDGKWIHIDGDDSCQMIEDEDVMTRNVSVLFFEIVDSDAEKLTWNPPVMDGEFKVCVKFPSCNSSGSISRNVFLELNEAQWMNRDEVIAAELGDSVPDFLIIDVERKDWIQRFASSGSSSDNVHDADQRVSEEGCHEITLKDNGTKYTLCETLQTWINPRSGADFCFPTYCFKRPSDGQWFRSFGRVGNIKLASRDAVLRNTHRFIYRKLDNNHQTTTMVNSATRCSSSQRSTIVSPNTFNTDTLKK